MHRAVMAAALAFTACAPPPPPPNDPSPDMSAPQRPLVLVNLNGRDKVDLLFMVDNSNSMEAMQSILEASFFEFWKPFDDLTRQKKFVDFHIGVVTSDYGAGASGAPGCSRSPGVHLGRLQAIGAKAPPSCKQPVGANFIQYNTDPNQLNNLPQGQGLADTFTCMASVGANGCGFEHQLESVYAALTTSPPENVGFLRPDAALAVAFVTNEDDASAPPDTDIFDKNRSQRYGYEASYPRQTRFAVMCCPLGKANCTDAERTFPPYDDSAGPLAGCKAAPNAPTGAGPGRQYDIQRYIDLFTRPAAQGGIKADPNDVILYAIDAPETPFQVILSNPGTIGGVMYRQCPRIDESSNPPCVPTLQHSCMNPDAPELFGDPPVRLNTVVRAAANHRIWSICDSNYGGALAQLAQMVVSQLGGGCIPDAQLPGATADNLDCTVLDVRNDVDQQVGTPIPKCGDNVLPCWRVEVKRTCSSLSRASLGLTIDRGGEPAPPGTRVRASCGLSQ